MSQVKNLRNQLKNVCKRLDSLVQRIQKEDVLTEDNLNLSLHQLNSLRIQISIQDNPIQRKNISKHVDSKQVNQKQTKEQVYLLSINQKQRQVSEDSFCRKPQKNKQKEQNQVKENLSKNEFKDKIIQTDQIKEKQQSKKIQATLKNDEYPKPQFQEEEKKSPQSQQQKNRHLSDLEKKFVISEVYNLHLEPIQRLSAQKSRLTSLNSLNYSKTRVFNKSSLGSLNKKLSDIFMKQEKYRLSYNYKGQNSLFTGKKAEEFQSLRSKSQSKCQKIFNSPYSCHDKCKYQTIDKQKSENSTKKISIKTIQQHPRTQQLIEEIRKYLQRQKIEKEYSCRIADKKKSYTTFKLRKNPNQEKKLVRQRLQ